MHEVNLAEEAEKIAETHDNFSGIIYSGLPGLMVISKKAYDAISDSFFLVAWISDTLAVGWRSISYLMSNNKNSHNTGDLILDWLLFGVGALFTFASAALLAILQVIGTAVMFIIYPFMSMAKSLYYLAKTITADTLEEAESHFSQVKENVVSCLISGAIGLIFASLIMIPALPLAAVITLSSIAAIVFLPPAAIQVANDLYTFASWVSNKVSKWWRKKQGLQGPGHRYDMRPGEGIENADLEEHIIYIDKLDQDHIGHKFLTYRIKDEAGNIRRGVFKQHALDEEKENEAWPLDLSETEIQKLRPYLDSFADSLLDTQKEPVRHLPKRYSAEKIAFIDRVANAVFPEKSQLPIHFKPKLNTKVVNELQINGVEHASLSLEQWSPMLSKKMDAEFNQKQKLYLEKERNDHHAHLCAPKLKSVEELIVEAQRQIEILKQHDDSYMHFFQQQKRQNKIHALQILVKSIVQWSELYQHKHSTYLEYNTIDLDEKTEIQRILNPHVDPDVTSNRETLITRIQTYVLQQYPNAYQSFFREQGSVATLFKQGFDLMRSMKTQAEIVSEANEIEAEINSYQKKYQERYDGWRKHFYDDAEIQRREDSINLLRAYLDGYISADKLIDHDEMKSSCRSNGERWEIYKKITALHDSKLKLEMDESQSANQARCG